MRSSRRLAMLVSRRGPKCRPGLHHPGVLRGECGGAVSLPRQVADDPGVIHTVSWRRDLRVGVLGWDLESVVLPYGVHLVSELGMAIPLGVGESVVINLRLGMVV